MTERTRVFSKKWLVLGILFSLFPFFQNMSPSDEFIDIRKIAPEKPRGNWSTPDATYFPTNIRARSLSDVQQSLLSHNFDPMLKDLELKYLVYESKRSPASSENLQKPEFLSQEKQGQWRFGLVNPTKLRLSYENTVAGRDLQVICEAQSGKEGISFRMSRPLTSKLNMGFSHETGPRQSQIEMNYTW